MTDHLDTLDLAALTREAERLGYMRRPGRVFGREHAHLGEWASHEGAPHALVYEAEDGEDWGPWTQLRGANEAAALRWLLRQPEALARAACYARGVAEERARVVVAARATSIEEMAVRGYGGDPGIACWGVLQRFANALERGEHEVTRG